MIDKIRVIAEEGGRVKYFPDISSTDDFSPLVEKINELVEAVNSSQNLGRGFLLGVMREFLTINRHTIHPVAPKVVNEFVSFLCGRLKDAPDYSGEVV